LSFFPTPAPTGQPRTSLCLCLAADTLRKDQALIEEYGRFVDVLELRVDCLIPEERGACAGLLANTRLPVILTVRNGRDGGRFEGGEGERTALLERLCVQGFSYIDLEEDLQARSLEAAAASKGCRVIRSLHDTQGVPRNLKARLRSLARNGRELPKAAVFIRGMADLLELLDVFARTRDREKILLGMGEAGFCTRILASRLGSALCYTSVPEAQAAPGHVDPRTAVELYRIRSIGPATGIFGVTGNPIRHSLSPLIHNTGFAELGIDAVYLPFPADEIGGMLQAARVLDVKGLSVTVPHKESVLPFLSKPDELVKAVGACNTVFPDPVSGGFAGTNTDVEGFLTPLCALFDGSVPKGLRATVIGAGGAARAVAYALAQYGADILVLGRTPERADAIARSVKGRAAGLDDAACALMEANSDLIVQTTPLGMDPHPEADPMPGYRFSGREIAYDLVYNKTRTRFLSRAQEAGCRTVDGKRMLLEQAYAQFRLFCGRAHPGVDMRGGRT
jgi:3-dehydroquinate dehydratase/shikimate dehydrogenase